MTDAEFMVRLGMELKVARIRKQLTQKELASLSGVGHAVIHLLERGKPNIRILTLKRLAEALERPISELL